MKRRSSKPNGQVGKKGVKVAFDGDVWPTANYSFADVRKPPRPRVQRPSRDGPRQESIQGN